MEVIIEQITRNNKVISYHKLQGDRITIGRAYDNDLVLQEEHVCPHHVEITFDESGAIVLSDNHSINGIRNSHNKKLEKTVKVTSGDIFVIGKCFLRILQPSHQVSQTKQLNILEDIARFANQWPLAMLSFSSFFILLLLNAYLTSFHELIWSKVIAKSLMISIGLLLVPAFIALMARIFKKEVKFFAIVVFCFLIFLSWDITGSIGEIFLFNWPDAWLIQFGSELIEFTIFTVFFVGSFYLASVLSLNKIVFTSFALVVSIVSLTHYSNQSDQVKLSPSFYATILPSKVLLTEPKSVSDVIVHNEDLYQQAEREAGRRNKEAQSNNDR